VPFAAPLALPGTWRRAFRLFGLIDAVAFVVAGVAISVWWQLLDGLDQEQTVSQLVRLGEDHLSHLLMFEATRESGTTLGQSAASIEVTSLFAGYYPGTSIWQTAVGGLVSSGSAVEQYVLTTLILFGLLALGASAIATAVTHRASVLAATAVLAIGMVASRASLAMYELGFPGQLLVASFLVAALVLLTTRHFPLWLSTGSLLLLAAASYWTWPLVAPVILAALVVALAQEVLRRWRPNTRTLALGAAAVVIVGMGAIVMEWSRIVATLDQLSTEGGVFRGIPLWLSFALVLALPLAWRITGRQLPLAPTVLVLGVGAITVLLIAWQIARLATVTYYTYKVEYLLLGLGWAAGTFWLASMGGRWETTLPRLVRIGLAVMAVVVAIPLVSWPSDNYRSWLTARAVLGPDPRITCAVRTAERVPDGSVVLAYGFGEPINNYLTTKAMDVSVENNYSATFWSAVLHQPDPATWPWLSTPRRLFLVTGPNSGRDQTDDILDAAAAAGTTVTVAGAC
jgi:hypothetical protein